MIKQFAGVMGLFLLTGCLAETIEEPVDVMPLRSPIDPNQEIRHQSNSNIVDGYTHRLPTDPGEWRKLNHEQTNPLGGAHGQ